MNIIIAGDGKVGATLTRLLCAEGHNITLIDINARVLETYGVYHTCRTLCDSRCGVAEARVTSCSLE